MELAIQYLSIENSTSLLNSTPRVHDDHPRRVPALASQSVQPVGSRRCDGGAECRGIVSDLRGYSKGSEMRVRLLGGVAYRREDSLQKQRCGRPLSVPRITLAFVLGIAVTIHICSAASTAAGEEISSTAKAERGAPHILVGAGDVHASCADLSEARATAQLLANTPGTIFADGDLASPDASLRDFERCYGPTWGHFKARTRPAIGNHEYDAKDAAGYFGYFGPRAGSNGKGYYSYELGCWHVVVLNANCSEIPGGCAAGSPEETWLRSDLQVHPAHCIVAYFHQPLFSSSEVGNDPAVKPFWEDLYRAGAALVINGHAHDYERFAPQDPDGVVDPTRGILEIIAGTGGKDHAHFIHIDPNSIVRDNTAFGVLKLTLYPGRYDWKFIPAAGFTFTDWGSGLCHRPLTDNKNQQRNAVGGSVK